MPARGIVASAQPCAPPASTPSTGAASTTPRASGARLRARSTGTCRRSACSTATRCPLARWFPDGRLNTCHNALDRHVEGGRGDQPALIYDSPVTGTQRTYSYAELRDEVARLAGALRGLGVERGDRVVLYLPMVPEALMAMLACARLGAIHSVVFGGFAAHELAVRIDDARPRVVLSASCGLEGARTIAYKPLLDAALERGARTRPSTA